MNDQARPATSALPKSARDTHQLLGRVKKTDAKTITAERLLSARMLNGYSQSDAAEKLGYGTTAQLSQWEQARRPAPLHMLMRASAVYRVSMDYLCGVSPEPDRDPQADHRRRLLAATDDITRNAVLTLTEFIAGSVNSGGPALDIAVLVLEEGEKFHRALARFIDLNRTAFEEDMKGSAPLLGMHERFEANALEPARRLLRRFTFSHSDAMKALDRRHQSDDLKTADLFKTAAE